MTNRTLFYLTSLVILGVIILLALNLTSILTGIPDNQTYLKYNDVRGIAIQVHDLPYTLNFQQQNQIIGIINRAVRITEIPSGQQQKPNFTSLTIYQFDGKPEIILTPIAYLNDNLIFSVPQWDPNNDFMELSKGNLQSLLSQTYDP